ncbi:MAG: O-methyltransferase [Lachnospiraceae bacterium]|nr:O-methyltransferase [Lachnospiraceae bacterium]
MIVNDRIVTYIHSLEKANSDLLEEIERHAHADGVPIIRKEMESFLRVMIGMNKPKKILELGTAVAYSAILMSECCDAKIVTIENYEPRINQAKKNITKAQKEEVITLLEGDALEILEKMDEEFDFVFMDAAKAQYINFLPHVMRLLKKGGILVADNVLQEGDLIESKFATRRRDRTIHTRMREFMYEVKHNPQLETTIVPIGDGVTVSIRL